MFKMTRRDLMAMMASAAPLAGWAQERRFAPQPGAWRTFEMTTRVEVASAQGATRVWLPIPSVDTDYQRSQDSNWSGNASATRVVSDSKYGAKML